MFNFEKQDGHLNLDNAYIEIEMLYKNYGLEEDIFLTVNAIEQKHEIIDFVNKIKQL